MPPLENKCLRYCTLRFDIFAYARRTYMYGYKQYSYTHVFLQWIHIKFCKYFLKVSYDRRAIWFRKRSRFHTFLKLFIRLCILKCNPMTNAHTCVVYVNACQSHWAVVTCIFCREELFVRLVKTRKLCTRVSVRGELFIVTSVCD